MTFFRITTVSFGLLALAACGDSSTSPGLTGADRTSFVEASVSSCKSAAQSQNPNLSASVIDQYCTCYSNKMADSISASEARSLNASDAAQIQAVLGTRINAAIAACRPTNLPAPAAPAAPAPVPAPAQ
jgi:hypothetical protein